jgi:hypothetical protein
LVFLGPSSKLTCLILPILHNNSFSVTCF